MLSTLLFCLLGICYSPLSDRILYDRILIYPLWHFWYAAWQQVLQLSPQLTKMLNEKNYMGENMSDFQMYFENLPELNIDYIYLYSKHFKMHLGSFWLTSFISPVSLERVRDGRGRIYLLNSYLLLFSSRFLSVFINQVRILQRCINYVQ